METRHFVVNMIEENCYLFWDETKEAALVDCGAFYANELKPIEETMEREGLHLACLLNTHAHFDHIWGTAAMVRKYNVPLMLCRNERDTYEAAPEQLKAFLHREIPLELTDNVQYFAPDAVLRVGGLEVKVIPTPGHTPGGVCFYVEKAGVLFSGDSLFRHSIGRCDLPGGNEAQLVGALRDRVLTLPEEVRVLPGHGPETTIGEERKCNFYIR